MAVTTPLNIDTSIPEFWSSYTLRSHLRTGFWGKFIGDEGSGSVMTQVDELLNGPGDLAHIQVGAPLTGAGVSGDNAKLEGFEENLTLSEIKAQPLLYRHGVRLNTRANQKSILDLQSEAKMRIAEWGQDKMDRVRWAQFVSTSASDTPDSTYTPNTYAAGNGHTAISDVTAADKLTVDVIRRAKYKLQAQNAKPYTGGSSYKGGFSEGYYFGVISPEQEFDLKNDTVYANYAVNAAERGGGNPIFSGALCIIDGVVLFPHFNVPTVTSTTRVAKSLFFGQEAFVEAVDQNAEWAERDFDYGHEMGFGYSFAFQPRRALELSSLQVWTSAVAPA